MARWRAPRSTDRIPESMPIGDHGAGEAQHQDAFNRTPDDKIVDLGGEESAALEKWKDRLSAYVDGQGTLDALRLRRPSEPPWPAADNPMLGYLYERSREIVITDGADTALAWLASNSWFEGAIAERSRFARHLNTD
jgi:hypothetical protein